MFALCSEPDPRRSICSTRHGCPMIKLPADENIPPRVVEYLRDRGFDVKEGTVAGAAGASDDHAMALESKERRGFHDPG